VPAPIAHHSASEKTESDMAAKYPSGVPSAPPKLPESAKVRDILEYRAGAGLDATLPPTPLKELLSAGGANVYVLSLDMELRDTVQRAGGEQYPVYTVDEWADLESAIARGHCGIAVLDAAVLGKSLPRRIAELERYHGRLVTLVAADRKDAQDLIGFLSDRKIHRLLIKPPALGITRLLLESAVSRCIQLREQGHAPDDTRSDARAHPAAAHSTAAPTGAPRLPAWLLATALVSLLLGVAVVAGFTTWWEPRGTTEAPPTAAVPARVEPSSVQQPPADRFAELLAMAERAFSEGRLAEPVGDNALDYYLTILAADPMHRLARERLAGIVEALFAQAEAALLDNSIEAAAAVLAHVRRADPTSGRLAFLDTQLERARAAVGDAARDAEREARAAAPAPPPAAAEQGELASLLTIAAARLQRGQLLEPAGDSAREYIARAGLLSPDDPAVLRARADLAAALVTTAGAVLSAGNPDAAERLLREARNLGAREQSVAPVEAELQTKRGALREQGNAALFARAQERMQSGALIEPKGDGALDALLSLEAGAPNYTGAAAVWQELMARLGTNARTALDGNDWAAAETWIGALARSGRDAAAVDALTRELNVARLRQEYLATAVPAREVELLSYSPPAYPRDAQIDGVEGWVELELVIDTTGRPRDVMAIRAEPMGRFERAATAAVAQYRYRPFVRDGETYERRVRLTIRFTLQ
jgi:TonB family protein